MKRRIIVALAFATAAAACSEQSLESDGQASATAASAWVQPPHIDGVVRQSGALVIKGAAGPRSRVVLRAPDGGAVAASADDSGRFELRLPGLAGDLLFTPEVQVGEDAAVSPETLVVLQGGSGPIVLIAPGEPTRRLDGGGPLEAVDTDGRGMIASGRHRGEGAFTLSIDGQPAQPVFRDDRWRATGPMSGEAAIVADGRSFAFPGHKGGGEGFSVGRDGAGWRLSWPVSPDGRQSTWLPDQPN